VIHFDNLLNRSSISVYQQSDKGRDQLISYMHNKSYLHKLNNMGNTLIRTFLGSCRCVKIHNIKYSDFLNKGKPM